MVNLSVSDRFKSGSPFMSSINRFSRNIEAEVTSNRKAGAYHHIALSVGEMAAFVRPGNFVAVQVGGDNSNMVLRRAFAIYRSVDLGGSKGQIEIVIAPHGAGSTWVAQRAVGEKLNIIGPLGTAFGIPTEPVRALLVGGGYGSAPLFGLSEVLKARGCRVDMVLGASTAMKIYAPLEGKRSVSALTITTDDGTAGIQGKVSDVIPDLIDNNSIDIVYSCGPMGMLEAITTITKEKGVLHQCAVEESMACGIGVCMTCVLPVKGEDGLIRMLRSCIDGPVMNGEDVIWNSKREVPEGTWGK
jgi:dihydroorotate dehydrogenase electron transfer subunit